MHLTIQSISRYIQYMLFFNYLKYSNSNLSMIEYIIQKRYILRYIFLYHDTYLDVCITIYRDTRWIFTPLPAGSFTCPGSSSNGICQGLYYKGRISLIIIIVSWCNQCCSLQAQLAPWGDNLPYWHHGSMEFMHHYHYGRISLIVIMMGWCLKQEQSVTA